MKADALEQNSTPTHLLTFLFLPPPTPASEHRCWDSFRRGITALKVVISHGCQRRQGSQVNRTVMMYRLASELWRR